MIYTQISDELSFKDIESSLDYDIKSYNIIQPLGQGANGFVCKIEDFKSKEFYAMKVVDKQRQDISNVMKRLEKEIKIQKELDHPNIIRLYKHFEDESNHYLIMELAKNGEIKDFLNNYKPLNENQIQDFSYQLACGIKYLHDKDIVHRDLKLNNVLLSDGIIKIADFGLATKITEDNPECNTMCGTANYLSPEILNKEGYGKKTDIWSFGIILYALCSGNLPFFSGNPSQTIQNILEGKWSLPVNVSDSIKDLLTNTLNWDQNQRYTIEQVLSHKVYEKKHKQSMIIFNQHSENTGNHLNKVSTPTKTLLDWTSPRFNGPIHILQKSHSSQKKNKQMNNLKNQKSLTSIKLDLSEFNKENDPSLRNANNQNNNNNNKNNKSKMDNRNNNIQQSINQAKQNFQNSMGMSNLFLTTARSINLGADNSLIQDLSIHNTKTGAASKPTQKLQNYLQQNSTPQQQLKQSNILSQQQSTSNTNIRNKFDQPSNNPLASSKSKQSLLQTNGQKQQSNSIPIQQTQSHSINNIQSTQMQHSQSQYKSSRDQTPKQFNPYMSQNNEQSQQDSVNNAFKSYRSTSSLHYTTQSTSSSQSHRDSLKQSQLIKNQLSVKQERQEFNKLPLHNVKKPLQYYSQQQNILKDGENIAFTQSQSQNRQTSQNNQQIRGDSNNNCAAMKYSSLSTMSKQHSKQDDSYIHNYSQPRIVAKAPSQPNSQKDSHSQILNKNQIDQINKYENQDRSKAYESQSQFNNSIKRNYSQQILPKDNSLATNPAPPLQKLQFANHIQNLCQKGVHNFLQEKKSQQVSNNNNNKIPVNNNMQNSQLINKSARSLSNNHISANQNYVKKDLSELSIKTTDRQLTFQGVLNEQTDRNMQFAKSPTQIQARNNSKSFSQSVNCPAAEKATSKDRKVSFVAQSVDLQEQNQLQSHSLLTKQSSIISQVDSKRSCQSDDVPLLQPISPLSTQGLKVNKVNTKNGFIEIQENSWLSIECQNGQLIFKISPDGKKIQIQKFQKNKYQKKDYELETLPEKYIKLYNYAKVVCQTLKAKTPLVKIQNEQGTFMLMSNQPKQNYEVSLTSGFKVSHVIGTDIMTVKNKQNNEYTVNLIQQKFNINIPAEITLAVKISLEQMSTCLQKQNEKYLANFK